MLLVHSYLTVVRPIKVPLPFVEGVRDPFPPSPRELFELSTHPL
jgi:hypothetical protein